MTSKLQSTRALYFFIQILVYCLVLNCVIFNTLPALLFLVRLPLNRKFGLSSQIIFLSKNDGWQNDWNSVIFFRDLKTNTETYRIVVKVWSFLWLCSHQCRMQAKKDSFLLDQVITFPKTNQDVMICWPNRSPPLLLEILVSFFLK